MVRRSPSLSLGQAVQRCFAVGKIEVRLAVGLMQCALRKPLLNDTTSS